MKNLGLEKERIEEALEFLEHIGELFPIVDALKPALQEVAEKAGELIGSISPLFERLQDWIRDRRMFAISEYGKAGYHREEAIMLAIADEYKFLSIWDTLKRIGRIPAVKKSGQE